MGRATAVALAEAGASVAVLARSVQEVDRTVDELRAAGHRAAGSSGDVADAAALADALHRLTGELSSIDVLVNNARVSWPVGPTAGIDPEQYAQAVVINRGVDPHDGVGLRAPALSREPVRALDAVLGVTAVAAHVELAGRAVEARHRIGPTYDPHNAVTPAQPAAGRRLEHLSQRLVAEHEPLLARRGRAVLTREQLAVGAADTHAPRRDQHAPLTRVGLRQVGEGVGPGPPGTTVRTRMPRPYPQD